MRSFMELREKKEALLRSSQSRPEYQSHEVKEESDESQESFGSPFASG